MKEIISLAVRALDRAMHDGIVTNDALVLAVRELLRNASLYNIANVHAHLGLMERRAVPVSDRRIAPSQGRINGKRFGAADRRQKIPTKDLPSTSTTG